MRTTCGRVDQTADTWNRIPRVPGAVNTFYVRSFAQVIGMLSATVVHAAASAVGATRRTR